MTMKEIDPLAQRDHMIETIHTVETDHGNAVIQTDPITEMIHIIEIDHKTITKMTIEMTITKMTIEMTITKMTIEMTIEMKSIETRDIRKNIKTIIKTHMTKVIIELATETRVGAKIDTKQRLIPR